MLFYTFFSKNINSYIEIVLKNDLHITGTLVSVDPYLNIKLENPSASSEFRGLNGLSTCSIRGSSIKHALLPFNAETAENLSAASRYRFMKK